MPWLKRQLIAEAFSELALSGYEFDLSPEEQMTALRRMDSMMALWEAKGIQVGYLMPASPDAADPDDDSGLPDMAVEPVFMNLAVRLAPGNGKALRPETKRTARDGYDLLESMSARDSMRTQLPRGGFPSGAGNRTWLEGHWRRTFLPDPPQSPLGVTPGGDLNIFPD